MKIGIIGLGYVGLPLAIALARESKFEIIGFDIDEKRIAELRKGIDRNGEESHICQERWIQTGCADFLADCRVYIVCVPTPITAANQPDLGPIEAATKLIAEHLKPGDLVIYESTVWPGMTEEFCGAILANATGLVLNDGFFLGYSPERINPGDKLHALNTVVKVISASHPSMLPTMRAIYRSVCHAGVHTAPDIRTAEAAKCIENIQRDINIALMNELKMLFDKMGMDTNAVLDAARTKWNFLDFRPGLVGGHCIGVDPYYLAEKAKQVGFDPQMILTGRAINDGMARYWYDRISQYLDMTARPKILVLGCTFKANVSDIRNSKVFELAHYFQLAGSDVSIYDPMADSQDVRRETGHELIDEFEWSQFDAVILAVPHRKILLKKFPENIRIFDICGGFPDPLPINVVR